MARVLRFNMMRYLYYAVLLFVFTSCSQTPPSNSPKQQFLKKKCCTQCIEAFNSSPAAIGKEGAQCGKFTTATQISQRCVEYFKKNPMTVDTCTRNP